MELKAQQNDIFHGNQSDLIIQFNYINDLIDHKSFEKAVHLLLDLHHADVADFLDQTNTKTLQVILPLIADRIHPETIVCLNDANKQKTVEILGITKVAQLVNNLYIEDAIETVDALDKELKDKLIASLEPDVRKHILKGFTFPEDTAGRVLQKDFIALKYNWTAEQAINFIRKSDLRDDDFYAAVVVDAKYRPIGTILISNLLQQESDTQITTIMNNEFKIAGTHTEIKNLSFVFKQYALTIVPVVNTKGVLIGTISINNMLYIISEQTENEFMNMGGVNNIDIFYNLYATAKHRFPWLFANLIIACLTSIIINQFSDTISRLIALAAFMPIVSSMAGNVGTQTMTVIIRALSNREVTGSNTLKVLCKEVIVCTLNGVLLAFIGMWVTYILFSEIHLSFVFACAVVMNFAIAGFLGSSIPIILNNINIDPATASGVFLTACTDATGFFSLLSLAYFFL